MGRLVGAAQTSEQRLTQRQRAADGEDLLLQELDVRRECNRRRAVSTKGIVAIAAALTARTRNADPG
jgi:hypothetical protein